MQITWISMSRKIRNTSGIYYSIVKNQLIDLIDTRMDTIHVIGLFAIERQLFLYCDLNLRENH